MAVTTSHLIGGPPDEQVTPSSADRSLSRLRLVFQLEQNITRMLVPVQEPPWRAIRAFQNAQGRAVVHLHNVSGGILTGDALDLSIHAGASTRVQVTTVGATRIYRHRPGNAAARLTTSIRIDDDAVLEYLPDVVIPYAGSRCHQSTTVSLGRNAGFAAWEILAAGRVASGEEFRFHSFRSDYEVRNANRPLVMERMRLLPFVLDPRSVARWGHFRYTATLYVCHTGVPPDRWLELERRLQELSLAIGPPTARWGVTTLIAGGIVVRGLALEAHHISAGLWKFWSVASEQLWGAAPIPPRKIN